MPESYDEVRDLLNKHPSCGVIYTGDITKYYQSKRYLTLEDLAKRMVEVNKFLGIDFKANTEEEWKKEILRVLNNLLTDKDYYKSEVMQLGIFKFFREARTSFDGCIRCFADIGTLMEEKYSKRGWK